MALLSGCGTPGEIKEGDLRVSTEYKSSPNSAQTTGKEFDCSKNSKDAECRAAYRLLEKVENGTPDETCTQQYGGPEHAKIVLATRERNITTELGRTNGCEIAMWDDLVPLLPEPVTSGTSPVQ